MDVPKVEVETESAGRYVDINLETLHRLVGQMGPDNSFLILQRSDKTNEFAQTAIARKPNSEMVNGAFVVEFKEASGQQYQAETKDLDRVRNALSGWAFDIAGWKDRLDWKPLDF